MINANKARWISEGEYDSYDSELFEVEFLIRKNAALKSFECRYKYRSKESLEYIISELYEADYEYKVDGKYLIISWND